MPAGAGPRPYRRLPGLHPGSGRLPGGARFAFCLGERALWLAAETPLPLAGLPLAAVPPTPAGALLALLEQAAETAAPDLQRQEDCLDRLEEALGRGQLQDFGVRALAVRRALAALHGGWAALARPGAGPAGGPRPPPDPRRARRLGPLCRPAPPACVTKPRRCREYTMQLWQVCHANIELRQTRVTTWADRCGHGVFAAGPCHGLVRHEFPEYAGPGRALGLPGVASAAALLALGGCGIAAAAVCWMPHLKNEKNILKNNKNILQNDMSCVYC